MSGSVRPEGITYPPIDDLLDKSDSKYSLVIYAAKRARQINAYYSQLGEGLLEYVGPLVETHVQEKPLSIAMREIDAGLLTDPADTAPFLTDWRKRQTGRALAVAQEAEYQAEAQKNRALVVLAEAEVPKAVSESLRTGKLGLMDYYRMQNVMADTQMRTAIGGGPQQG